MSSSMVKASSGSAGSQSTNTTPGTSSTVSPDAVLSKDEHIQVNKPTPRGYKEDILREVCANNGLNFNKLENGEGESIDVLEMFFSGFPQLICLNYFPNLHTLTVIGQTVSKIEGLDPLTKLKELWLCECEIKKIENLCHLKSLTKLYLYSNEIEKIENLSTLKNLEVLWLNNNIITNIENTSELSHLMELNLAENEIKLIGHSLDNNTCLIDINLSGNPLSSLKDITNFVRLPILTSISFKDPQYNPAPVSILCNYSTHVLYHLPNLQRLDTYDVSAKHLAELAESTVAKKKMYYNMRVKTIHCNLFNVINKLEKYRDKLLEYPQQKIWTLVSAIKELEREEEIQVLSTDANSDTESDRDAKGLKDDSEIKSTQAIVNKLQALKKRRKEWEEKCSEIAAHCEDTVNRITDQSDTLIGRLTIELETGGNVRFEEGSPSDLWFSSCHDLVLSRFCGADYRDKGIMGIKIHRIIRIHHRMLKTKFDAKLNDLTEDKTVEEFPVVKSNNYKKHLEYLFWIWDPSSPGGLQEPTRVLEDGFSDEKTYKKLDRIPAVPLSNSLCLADKKRINYLDQANKKKKHLTSCPFKYGQILVCKAYLGKTATSVEDKTIGRSSYPNIDSVIRSRKNCSFVEHKSDIDLTATCECSVRQCEWYVFDNELVLPEYMIEYEYITRLKSKSNFSCVNGNLAENKDWKIPPPAEEQPQTSDSDVLDMEPDIKPRPRLITLSEDIILKMGRATMLCSVTSLNLHGNGLTKLKYIQSLTSLKRLIVSFNELTRLDDLGHMGIEYIDASFNKIITLDGMKGMVQLHHLDISWNKLQNTREELSMMRKHLPHLKTLNIVNNPWAKPVNLRLRVIGRLKSLTQLNGQMVREEEATSALRVAAGSRISQLALAAHSRLDDQLPRSLRIANGPQLISTISRLKPDKLTDHDTAWLSKITTIVLEGQHITKLSNLEKLENLRWVSFKNNDLTKIEGLENCSKMEELSLENNCLAKLEGLSKLVNLKKLHLGNNHITSLDTGVFNGLTQLTYLSLECNRISSLLGLQRLQNLTEFYVGNNRIHSMRELFSLKPLQNLVILDSYGNPIATEVDNYRLFIIYHLKALRALDGRAIEANEGNVAKEMFGGRLTSDFIADKLFHSNFTEVRELDLPTCSIKTVDLGRGELFTNLRSVNLENNNLSSFSGLIYLVNVRVLCLNHNTIECILPRPKNKKSSGGEFCTDSYSPVLESLEVLHLGYNNIKDMAALQLNRLPSIKALFLQGNEICKIEGLDGLHELRELVLDRNKIKNVSELSFFNQWNLQELHLEENRLRDLSNLACLENLQRLYLGTNRIQDLGELEKIDNIVTLMELSLVNNAVARRLLHRPLLIYRMPQLMIIDGIPVSDEERAKAEIYFAEQQQYIQQPNSHTVEGTLPGIGHYKSTVPVKVTNVQLSSPPVFMYEDSENTRGRRRGQRGELGNPSRNGMNYQPIGTNQMYGYSVNNSSSNNNRNQYGYLHHMPQINQHTAEYMESLARLNNVRNGRR